MGSIGLLTKFSKHRTAFAIAAIIPILSSQTRAEDVTLKATVGGEFSIAGRLADFDGQTFTVISPQFGRVQVGADRFECIGLECPGQKKEITLALRGGAFTVVGILESFDGNTYTITSPTLGRMSLAADKFSCQGGECPNGTITASLDVSSPGLSNPPEEISIGGSKVIGRQLMPSLVKAFAEFAELKTSRRDQGTASQAKYELSNSSQQTVARVSLNATGSDDAFRGLAKNRDLIGMSARPIRTTEYQILTDAGRGDMRSPQHQHALAKEALAVIVGKENPATDLSVELVSRIFSGQLTDWAQLGLRPGSINLYVPPASSSIWSSLQSQIPNLRPNISPIGAPIVADEEKLSELVSADQFGIGLVGRTNIGAAKPLRLNVTCGPAISPSRFAVQTGEYPLIRTHYLYTAGTPAGVLSKRFLEFAVSRAAGRTIREAGFTDRTPEDASLEDQQARVAYGVSVPSENFDADLMADLLQSSLVSNRLSYTFRFKPASTALDQESADLVKELVPELIGGRFKDQAIRLKGFTDSIGIFDQNRSLALRRARSVRSAILQEGGGRISPARLQAFGYGELTPVACDRTSTGRRLNRRVELWVENPTKQ